MRHARLSFVAVAVVVAVFVGRASAEETANVRLQAWSHTGLARTFSPAEGNIYIAATLGIEQARAFVQLDVGGADVSGGEVRLLPAEDRLFDAGVTIAVCAAATALTTDGELPPAEVPPDDCTTRVDLQPDEDGELVVPLAPFASGWATGGEGAGALVLKPVTEAGTASYRLSFDTTKTALVGLTRPEPSTPTTSEVDEAPFTSIPPFAPPPSVTFEDLPVPPFTAPASPAPASPEPSEVVGPERPTARSAASPSVVPFLLVLALITLVVLAATPLRRRLEMPPRLQGDRLPSLVGVGALATIALLPLLASEVTIYRAGLVLIFITAVLGLQVLVNWAGQLSLAHAGMVGLPAFTVLTVSEIHDISPIYLLPLGLAAGAGIGTVVALPTLRAKGLQVALVTIAAGLAFDRFFFTRPWLVGSSGGRTAATPSFGPLEFVTSRSLYPVLLVIVAGCAVLTWFLMHSKTARAWFWINADPAAAAAFGIPVTRYRILAYAVAGAYAGLAGTLTVLWVQRLTPQAFPTGLSFTYLLVAVLAGPGYLGGVAVASIALEGGRLFSSGAGTLVSYLGPIGLIFVITRYRAGLNGAGRNIMQRVRVFDRVKRHTVRTAEPEPISLALVAGTVAIAAGFIAIVVAWYHAGNTRETWIQNQELLSGGIGGLGMIMVGVGLLIRDQIGRGQEKLLWRLDLAFGMTRNEPTSAPEPDRVGTAVALGNTADQGGEEPVPKRRPHRTPVGTT